MENTTSQTGKHALGAGQEIKSPKKDNVEMVRVTSGHKKTQNALKVLQNAVINIERGNYIKNRLSCRYCKFHNTENCT